MKKWVKLSLALSSALIINHHALAATQSLDNIVAIVNKTVITQSELDEGIARIKKQLIATHTPIPPSAVLRKQILDQLINRKLQLDMATQAGVIVTDADVTKAIKTVAEKNKVTPEKLYSLVAEQGLTKQAYRQEIHDEMAINQVEQQMIGSKINITQQEVDDFMRSPTWLSYNGKEYHLEDILIALPEKPTAKDTAEAKARVQSVLAKLHQGASFAEAAVADSSGSKALQGGDLGWRKLPEIPTAFANRLVTMKENEIAGPIQTPNGYHIIRVAGIRHVSMQGSKDEQRKQIQALLYQRKFEEALQTWTTRLRSEAYINMHPDA